MSAFAAIKKNEDAGTAETEKAKGGGKGGEGGGMKNMPPALRAAMDQAKKAKTPEEMTKAMADLEKAMTEAEAEAEKAEVAKNDDTPATPAPEQAPEVSLHEALAEMGRAAVDISKGRFVTEARAKALFAGLEKMAAAAFEMDPVSFGVFAEKMMNMLPAGTPPRSGVRPSGVGSGPIDPKANPESPAPVKKNEGDDTLAEVKKMLGDLGTRLEAVEKARGTPAGDGGSDTTAEVQKNKGGFWTGVPL